MKSKIEKLQELQELLKAEAISQEEFETLKKEILEDKSTSKEEAKTTKDETPKEKTTEQKKGKKVILKAFYNAQNSRIEPPKITHIDFDDISDDEIKELKQFLRKKYADAPSEMTPDEIEIGNKLFSYGEIDDINASRDGFNYPFFSIVSLLCALAALIVILVLPCLIIIIGGTGLIGSIVLALTVVNKADSTQLDKKFSYAALVIAAICIFLYIKDPFKGVLTSNSDSSWFSGDSSNENIENTPLIDCSQSVRSYQQGYSNGKMVLTLGGTRNCETYVEKVNYETGRNIMNASECFCAGFDEAIALKVERYVSSNIVIEDKSQLSEEKSQLSEEDEMRLREEELQEIHDNLWISFNKFFDTFKIAVKNKNKMKVLELCNTKVTYANNEKNFFDDNGDFIDKVGWDAIQNSVNSGVYHELGCVFTKDDNFSMQFCGDDLGNWKWVAIVGY